MFQFLGRNSGRSDPTWGYTAINQTTSFNSSVGILVVRTPKAFPSSRLITLVSIPRSEFWSFGPRNTMTLTAVLGGFNSSVGILVVRTALLHRPRSSALGVSIPRSEFWSFGRAITVSETCNEFRVSIPRSEFWSFGQH